MDDQADRILSRIYDIRVATATTTTTTTPETTHTSPTELLQSPPHDAQPTATVTLTNTSPTIQPPHDASMYDDLPDLIYSSTASLMDDQKNSSYRTTNTQTTGATSHAPYDIRVATHHEDSADSASIDSDHTHDPPGADEADPPDAQYHHSTDDEEPHPPPLERADPTDYQLLGWISAAIP